MDKIEKIRQEIERQMKFYDEKEMKAWDDSEQGDEDALWYQGHRKMCAKLLSFLDTLSEEPELVRHPPIAYTYPSDASRDEQLKMALLALLGSDLIKVAGNKFTKQDLIDWVEKQKDQEEPDKSLEEEITRYGQEEMPVVLESDLNDIARHFAKWQKEQMMKDAYVESLIVEDGRIELEGDPLPCLNPIILLPYPQFKPGDKAKLIIIKED